MRVRKNVPGHIQQQMIQAAADRREKRSQKLLINGIMRDAGYYRCNPEINPNFAKAMFIAPAKVAA